MRPVLLQNVSFDPDKQITNNHNPDICNTILLYFIFHFFLRDLYDISHNYDNTYHIPKFYIVIYMLCFHPYATQFSSMAHPHPISYNTFSFHMI